MATWMVGERGPEAPLIRINEQSTRTEIAEAIRVLKARHDRLPVHYRDDRHEIMDTIDTLIDYWLQARA